MQKCANLVELEKCCQTHIFLQNFVLIQPRTSLPKICKILEKIVNVANFAIQNDTLRKDRTRGQVRRAPLADRAKLPRPHPAGAVRPLRSDPDTQVWGFWRNLTGLVLGCIEAKFCKKICVWKLSPRSTQCTPLHRSFKKFHVLLWKFSFFADFSKNRVNI